MKANKTLLAEQRIFCQSLVGLTKSMAIKLVEDKGYSYAIYTIKQYQRYNFIRNISMPSRVNIVVESQMVDIYVRNAFFG